MVHGKTEEMRAIDSEQMYKPIEFVDKTGWRPIEKGKGKNKVFFKPRNLMPVRGASRDRTLRGKARRKARKESRKS